MSKYARNHCTLPSHVIANVNHRPVRTRTQDEIDENNYRHLNNLLLLVEQYERYNANVMRGLSATADTRTKMKDFYAVHKQTIYSCPATFSAFDSGSPGAFHSASTSVSDSASTFVSDSASTSTYFSDYASISNYFFGLSSFSSSSLGCNDKKHALLQNLMQLNAMLATNQK